MAPKISNYITTAPLSINQKLDVIIANLDSRLAWWLFWCFFFMYVDHWNGVFDLDLGGRPWTKKCIESK